MNPTPITMKEKIAGGGCRGTNTGIVMITTPREDLRTSDDVNQDDSVVDDLRAILFADETEKYAQGEEPLGGGVT